MAADTATTPSLKAPIRRRPLISLTPLIDVVFILLVFFMLASSFLDWRAINLSPPVKAGGGAPLEGAMLIEIRKDGLRLGGRRMTLEDLVVEVRSSMDAGTGHRVILRPDAGVSLQRTVGVFDRLAAAGVTGMSLIRARRS